MYYWLQFKSNFLFLSYYVRETDQIICCDVLLLGLTFDYSLILEAKLGKSMGLDHYNASPKIFQYYIEKAKDHKSSQN